jgi:acyl carrier protein
LSSSFDQRIQRVFREVFYDDELKLSDDLSPRTMPEWDSLAQVRLIASLEDEFNVKFTTDELVAADSVAKMKGILAQKSN